jgi:hypothetical protein
MANDDAGKDTPPDRLIVAFATADVTLTGWRLDRLAERLRDGELLAVRALPSRYAQFDQTKCAVASITIEQISKE